MDNATLAEMTINGLVGIFLASDGKRWLDIDRATGGANMCWDASEELFHWMRGRVSRAHMCKLTHEHIYDYYAPVDDISEWAWHIVTRVEHRGIFFIIDLTPRQFNESLDFPYIYPIEEDAQGVFEWVGTPDAGLDKARVDGLICLSKD